MPRDRLVLEVPTSHLLTQKKRKIILERSFKQNITKVILKLSIMLEMFASFEWYLEVTASDTDSFIMTTKP